METNNFHSWNHNFKLYAFAPETKKNNKLSPNMHVARTTPNSEKIQRRGSKDNRAQFHL